MDLSKHRALKYGHRLIANRIIICDEPLSRESREELSRLRTPDASGVVLLDDLALSETLEIFLGETLQSAKNALIVFPGNGAQYPRRHLRTLEEFANVEVPAWRLWTPGSEPVACVGAILPDRFFHLGLELVVVVDDVISSGATMLALHRRNAWRFPKARWAAAAWVIQSPRSRAPSGLSGYDTVLGGYVVSKPDGGRSAINSLSTLRADSALARSYAERHLVEGDRDKFFRCLQT